MAIRLLKLVGTEGEQVLAITSLEFKMGTIKFELPLNYDEIFS